MTQVVGSWSDILHFLDSLRDGTTNDSTFAHLYQKLTLGRLPLPPEFSIRDAQKILYYLLVHENDIEKFYSQVHSKGLGLGDDLEFREDVNARAEGGITMDVPTELTVQTKSSKSPIISVLAKDDFKDPHVIKKPRKKDSLSSVVKKLSLGKIEFQAPDQSEESGNKIPTFPDQLESPTKTPKKPKRTYSGSPRSPRVESETLRSRTSSFGSKLKTVSLKNSGKKKIRASAENLLETETSPENPEIGLSPRDMENFEEKNSPKKKFHHNLVDLGQSVQGHCRGCNDEVPHPKQKTLFCTICSLVVHSSCIESAHKQKCKEEQQTKHLSILPKHKKTHKTSRTSEPKESPHWAHPPDPGRSQGPREGRFWWEIRPLCGGYLHCLF